MLAALAAPSLARAQPIRFRDAAGRTVSLAAPPRRIIAIFSSNVELVAALSLMDRIVGVDAATTWPAEVARIPKVGGRLGFSVDLVVAQRPDLVLVTPARSAMHQLLDPMERIGVPVAVLNSRTMDEVLANVRLVGVACGERAKGEAVARGLENRLSAVAGRVAGRVRPSAVMIRGRVGEGLLLVAQHGTYTGDCVLLAGGRHALGPAVTGGVSPEAIWTADPDFLLYAGSQAEFDELKLRPGWRRMRAIRTGSAHIVSRGEFLIPGPRCVDGVEKLADLFFPAPSAA